MKNIFKIRLSEKISSNAFVHSRYFSWVSFIISLLILFGVWFFSERFFYNQVQLKFEHHVSENKDTLKYTLRQYEHALHSGVGFFQASDKVTRDDWFYFIRALAPKDYYPGMQGIGYSMIIPPDQIAFIQEKLRHEGMTSFELKPKGDRELYTAILYLEPLDKRNQAAIGYDMFSEPVRREAMERARDTGNAALSGKVHLLQEIDKDIQAGVLMYLPYYAELEGLSTVENRRQSLLGYVYAPFRMNDLITSISPNNTTLDVEIYDGEGRRSDNLLYKSPQSSSSLSLYHSHRTLDIGGRVWHIYYSSSTAFDAYNSSLYPILFAIIGVFMYLIMLYVIVELIKKRSLLKTQTKLIERNRAWLDTLLKSATDGIHILNTEGKLIDCSLSFLEMLGYTAADANRLFVFDWEAKISPEVVRSMMESVSSKPTAFETIFRRKDGSTFDAEVTARTITDDGKKYIYASTRDISERKAAEKVLRQTQEKLKESEAFYRTIFGSIEDSIIVLNDNYVVDCNDLALKLFNTTKEQFVGQSIFDTLYEIECYDYSLHHHINIAYNGEFTSTKCMLRMKENLDIVKIVEFTFSRFGSEDENKLLLISRDITRKVEEEKLFTMHARQAQMGEMISMIAHQWRQPLAIINAITSQMRLKAMIREDNDTEFIQNMIKIEQQSSHLSQTISDYRDFFRPDKPKEHFNVVSLIDHALNLIDHTLKSHSIHIENIHLHNPMLYSYRNEVLQVLIVLLKNALDAFIENRVSRGVITIGARPEGKYCVITVHDNAGGIAKEVINKLFSHYFTTKNESFGTGLGLYMSRIIIQEHCNGAITVSSEEDSTTFTIKLPYEEEK
ncbi:MAG: CHASE domain-containing protein [Campylobacterales bacterium]|nr:CHASE domain-containing protein [Campylobacterales bacterium]